MIYLDYAASAPLFPASVQAMHQATLSCWGNPGALHTQGNEARQILQDGRRAVADLLGVRPEEVFFTSGGTESNNWGVRLGCAPGRRHIVASAAEHKSILNPLISLSRQGYSFTLVNPDSDGRIHSDDIARALRPDTGLLCVQAVNNETGVIQDIPAIAALAHRHGIPYLCDAVQSAGHLELPLNQADYISVSAHKLGGPKGIGCFVVRYPHALPALLDGGGQESGCRSGTENIPAIAGFAAAAGICRDRMASERQRLRALSREFIAMLRDFCPKMVLNGENAPRHPGIVSCRFPGISAEALVIKLDAKGICVSPGAACSTRDPQASHVLLSMGCSPQEAGQTIRFSLGWMTTREELCHTARCLQEILAQGSAGGFGRY